MSKKLKVAIICGGQSPEHRVSLQSARNIWQAIDRQKFQAYLIGIDQKGRWRFYHAGQKFFWHENDIQKIKLAPGWQPVNFQFGKKQRLFFPDGRKLKIDVVFPILHGRFGEDGVIQALLEMSGFPYVGSGVLGSAVGMDKTMAKQIWLRNNLPVTNFFVVHKNLKPSFTEMKQLLGLPLFIKPANTGSSIGVSKVKTEPEYRVALDLALSYDDKVLIEEFIDGREIECSLLDDGKELYASTPGEIMTRAAEFYSYEVKYVRKNSVRLEIPARIDQKIVNQVQQLAKKAFRVIDARDLARVDFFLKKNGELIINEINTMPGFTAMSMYPKLFAHDGVKLQALLTKLLTTAYIRASAAA